MNIIQEAQEQLLSKANSRKDTILSNFKNTSDEVLSHNIQKSLDSQDNFLELNENEFDDLINKGETTILSPENLTKYMIDLKNNFEKGEVSQIEFEKAKKDMSKLVKVTKNITKNGRTVAMSYWVSPKEADKLDKKESGSEESKEKQPNKGNIDSKTVNGYFISALKQKNGVSKEGLEEVQHHYTELSHINKIRFEKEWKNKTGKDFNSKTEYGKDTKIDKEKEESNTKKDKLIIGRTKSGKPIHYNSSNPKNHKEYTKEDHADAAEKHMRIGSPLKSYLRNKEYKDDNEKKDYEKRSNHHFLESNKHVKIQEGK